MDLLKPTNADAPGPGPAPGTEADAPPAPPVVCRMLRTKTFFGTYTSTGEDWRTGDSTTAVYWCLDTMETAGPDDRLAHPHGCGPGRTCFKPELE